MLLFDKTYKTPFKYDVPNYTKDYLLKKSIFQRFIKFFKRYLYIKLRGQKNLEIFSILEKHQKILWINLSAPSLGDSLMDLSSRSMLTDKNIDLFTDEKNQHIYQDDEVFNNVFTKIKDAKTIQYDLIILDAFSSRSIRVKSLIAPKSPYVGMFGYFNGPEVNRILFSFHQMNKLLGYSLTENQINNIAKNLITITQSDKTMCKNILPDEYITIVLGGEWQYKTYEKWDEVIDKLIIDNTELNVVFVGSENAISESNRILKMFPNNNFYNLTCLLTFNQTVQVIKSSKIVLCCDGGLLHGSSAVNANIIALFARLTPEMLLTRNTLSFNLYDESNVNNITPEDVLLKYFEASNFFDSHPQGE